MGGGCIGIGWVDGGGESAEFAGGAAIIGAKSIAAFASKFFALAAASNVASVLIEDKVNGLALVFSAVIFAVSVKGGNVINKGGGDCGGRCALFNNS